MLVEIASVHDVAAALAKVKNWKAPGSSGNLPEMVKAGTDNLFSVWKEECMSSLCPEWVNAILIPILKKENLRCCDNRRRISSLHVGGG